MPARVVAVRRSRRRAFAPLQAVPSWIRALLRALRGGEGARPITLDRAGEPDLAVDAPAQIPVVVSDSVCTACGACVDACPSRCLYLARGGEGGLEADGAAPTSLEIDPARCIGCGRCVDACPEGVLSLRPASRASFAPIGRASRRVTLGKSVAGPV